MSLIAAATDPNTGVLEATKSSSPVGQILNDSKLIPGFKYDGATQLGTILTDAYQVVFLIATFTAFYWLVWGVFEYIFAGGDKNGIASARKRITWAIFGLIFVLLAYLIAQWAGQVILPDEKGVNQPFTTLPIF